MPNKHGLGVNKPGKTKREWPTFSLSLRPTSPSLTVTLIALIQTLLEVKPFTSSPFHTLA